MDITGFFAGVVAAVTAFFGAAAPDQPAPADAPPRLRPLSSPPTTIHQAPTTKLGPRDRDSEPESRSRRPCLHSSTTRSCWRSSIAIS